MIANDKAQIVSSEEETQIEIMILSGYPLIYVLTWEEERALRSLRRVAERTGMKLQTWTVSEGLQGGQGQQRAPASRTPPELEVLDQMIAHRDSAIFVLLDYHPYMDKPQIVRRLRDLVAAFRKSNRTLIFVSPVMTLPIELEKDIAMIGYSLPKPNRLRQVLERIIAQAPDVQCEVNLDEEGKEMLVKAMQGLTENQAENVLAKAMVTDLTLSIKDVEIIHREKEQIIRKSGILEFYSSPEGFKGVGGLEPLKEWFGTRKDSFTDRARAFGLPAPKGILLLGVPGCGKSLCAKTLAAEWDKPLLRFDVGRIFGGLVGQSEQNMRLAIEVAESVAPTILWIDEIEKGFAGMQGRGDSGGVVSRVFGTLITWMQEKTAPVFVIATANDISQLPPEMLRKGRFDELFFVDLPFEDERAKIFEIHLEKRQRKPADFNLPELARRTEGFSGAEIEQVIISALFDAFDRNVVLSDEALFTSIKETQPLSKTMDVQISALREWAKNRCRYASEAQWRQSTSDTKAKYVLGDEGFKLRFGASTD